MTPANSLLIKLSAELLQLCSRVDAVKEIILSLAETETSTDRALVKITCEARRELDEKWNSLSADFNKLQESAE